MTAAKVSLWLKREGHVVTHGEPLLEVETDKTTVEIEAPVSGVLREIRVQAGTDGVPVGTVLAVIAEGAASIVPAANHRIEPDTSTPEEDGAVRPGAHGETDAQPATTAPAVSDAVVTPSGAETPGHTSASPLARKMAALAGIDLSTLTPGGNRDHVTKADVDEALARTRPAVASAEAIFRPPAVFPAARFLPPDSSAMFDDRPLSPMRRTSAERLQRAKQTIPHFYLQTECHADALWRLRAQLNASGAGVNVTLTDLIVLATTRALLKVPTANAMLVETAVRVYESIDIAVAVNTQRGLITPIVRGTQNKPLGMISRELGDLIERARGGKLRPDEYTGGTFTISNLGMFGVTSITPIINPPQACILGVGRIEERAVVVNNQVTVGRTMSCTLAADHRVVDGATGAELLGEIRRLIEDPVAMALHL
jgi:pyruvate dehydrogenase E2 component (dihydrolipoamide acetyltransferase)